MTDFLTKIIEATKTKKLHWEKEGKDTFTSFGDNNCLYSVSGKSNGEKVFEAINDKGESFCLIASSKMQDTDLPALLYETIVDTNEELRKSVSSSVSLTKIKERLLGGQKLNIKEDSPLRFIQTEDPYVEPNFSQQITWNGKTPIAEAQVIAVSAAGATGKTALTENLSSNLKIPVFNLQKNEAVGSHSLLGMLYDTLPIQEFSSYIQELKDGSATMIIDALDEGYVKTNQAAFESFLNDIVSIASDNSGVPFVIMGRTSILEYATMYLEENGVRVSMVQIEPFIRKKAEDFIDIVLTKKREKKITYQKEYKEARNYILDSLEAFFEKESDISKLQSERFIGYAPVLLSIVSLMHEQDQNYYLLHSELKKSNKKNVDLIRNIIEMIMTREQEKVKGMTRNLLEGKSDNVDGVLIRAYDITEQCKRILCFANGVEYQEKLTGDPSIDEQYEEQIQRWFKEHPFIANNKIQNIVFEGYVVSKLILMDKYREDVIRYLDINWRNSYILFDLYNIIDSEKRVVDKRFIKYLIDSYKATEKGNNRHFIEIISDCRHEDGSVECELTFEKIGNVEYKPYLFSLRKDEVLELPSVLSNIYIDASVNISLNRKQVELSPMLNICCKKLIIPSEDILITPSRLDDSIIFESDEFEGQNKEGKLQNISNNGNVSFNILTDSDLYYPFASYRKCRKGELPDDGDFVDKYQKMRRTILQFRAHSKGSLAKYKDKIDNRIGNTPIGKRVVNKLLEERILEEKGQMYFINDTMMSEKLGIGYNELRTYEVNEKVTAFLNSV